MLEAQKVSISEIQAWRKQIENGDLSDVGAVYQQLAKRGYHYAKWAYGVASADSITGNGALEFMQSVAKEHNHTLTTDETNNVDINYRTLYEPMRLIERYTSAKLPNEQVVTGKDIVELM